FLRTLGAPRENPPRGRLAPRTRPPAADDRRRPRRDLRADPPARLLALPARDRLPGARGRRAGAGRAAPGARPRRRRRRGPGVPPPGGEVVLAAAAARRTPRGRTAGCGSRAAVAPRLPGRRRRRRAGGAARLRRDAAAAFAPGGAAHLRRGPGPRRARRRARHRRTRRAHAAAAVAQGAQGLRRTEASAMTRLDPADEQRLDWALREVTGAEAPPDLTEAVLARRAAGDGTRLAAGFAPEPRRTSRWLVAALVLLGAGVVSGVAMWPRAQIDADATPAPVQQPAPEPPPARVYNQQDIEALPEGTRAIEAHDLDNLALAPLLRLRELRELEIRYDHS